MVEGETLVIPSARAKDDADVEALHPWVKLLHTIQA